MGAHRPCRGDQGGADLTDTPQHRLYGRRKGHRLRKGQARLLREMLPRLRVDLGAPPLEPARFFDRPYSEYWLEIGFGAGEHLVRQARDHPDTGIIGCEPFINGVAQCLSRIEAHGIGNVRLHAGDARDLLDRMVDSGLRRVFLLFPDPWPKVRHRKRRFVSWENLDRLARVVAPGGEFRFASDIPDYVCWTLLHMRRHGAFDWCAERPSDWRVRADDWPETRYERKAVAAGRRPSYLRFCRVPDG